MARSQQSEAAKGLSAIVEQLLPGGEGDREFRAFIARLGYAGLHIIAAVELAAPILILLGRFAVEPKAAFTGGRLWQCGAMAAAGAATLALSRLRWSLRHPRLLAGGSIWAASVLLIGISLWKLHQEFGSDDYILAGISVVVLTAVAVVPFRPADILALGLSLDAVYFLSHHFAFGLAVSPAPAHLAAHDVFLLMLALLATGISATNYAHRKLEFEGQQEALRAAEALARAQSRAQLAENAISIGKLASALTHEINTPLGTLRSSIDTLLALTDRQVDAPAQKRELLARMRAELCRSIAESAARIEHVMLRLRRFAILEEAELKSADVNDLLSDVALLYEEQIQAGKIRLEFELEDTLPRLTCRPQLLSTVFSSLLSNAINAVNGDGMIGISTHRRDSSVEITIRDNGRGMSAEEAEQIFDPSFKVADNRVSSGNWSLFNTRQIIYEHGGDIRLETASGKGTAVSVTLPLA